MNPQTIAVYLRVSTEDQAREGFSLSNQEESNRSYIAHRFGANARVAIYKDVESGFSVERKDYLRLLEDCRQRKLDAVVVWRLDRFTRNTSAGLAALSELTVQYNIPVFSVSEGKIDFNDPNNKLLNTFLVGMAEFERNRIQQRVMPGMKKGAQMGHYQGTRYVFYGATYDKPMQRLEWVKKEVRILRILFERMASGQSITKTAEYLHEQGYRDREGKPFNKPFLYKTIRREIYTDGYYRWNGIVSEKPILEPVIDRVTWEKANSTIRINKARMDPSMGRGSRRDESPYILQGTLKCRRCGANMHGHLVSGFRYYYCSNYLYRTKRVCKGQWVKAEPIETKAREILKAALSNPDFLKAARAHLTRMISERNPEMLSAIRLQERQLREFDDQHSKLLDLYYKNGLSAEQFKSENERINAQQKVVQTSLDQLRAKLEVLKTHSSQVQRIFRVMEKFDLIYDKAAPKTKKNFYSWVFQYIKAKKVGKFRPVSFKIDQFELLYPFKLLAQNLNKQGGEFKSKNQSKLEVAGPLGFLSFPMAVR